MNIRPEDLGKEVVIDYRGRRSVARLMRLKGGLVEVKGFVVEMNGDYGIATERLFDIDPNLIKAIL